MKRTKKIQFLKANGLTNLVFLRGELCGDVSQMKEEISSLKQDQHYDSL